MSNLRIVYKNIVDTASSLTASSTAGSLVAANMLTEVKTEIHRSTGSSVIYTLNWAANQRVNCVALPCTNLLANATITVTLKDGAAATIATANKSTVITFDAPTTHTVNDFSLGKFTSICVFFSSVATTVRSCEISVSAVGIPAGFIDCSRIVVGEYWSPTYNFENGIDINISDSSSVSRTNAGELVTDRGFIYEKIDFKYALLVDADRDKLVSIFKEVGIHKNFLLCLFPNNTTASTQNEALFTIYGKRSNTSIVHRSFGYYNHSMEVTSW